MLRALVGSVSGYCLRHASCPVAILLDADGDADADADADAEADAKAGPSMATSYLPGPIV